MNTIPFTSIFDSLSAWGKSHSFTLGVMGFLATLALGKFALATDLERVEQKADSALKQNRIQELRYHIDTLSKIKPLDMPPEIKRALDDYKKEKAHLLKPSS